MVEAGDDLETREVLFAISWIVAKAGVFDAHWEATLETLTEAAATTTVHPSNKEFQDIALRNTVKADHVRNKGWGEGERRNAKGSLHPAAPKSSTSILPDLTTSVLPVDLPPFPWDVTGSAKNIKIAAETFNRMLVSGRVLMPIMGREGAAADGAIITYGGAGGEGHQGQGIALGQGGMTTREYISPYQLREHKEDEEKGRDLLVRSLSAGRELMACYGRLDAKLRLVEVCTKHYCNGKTYQ
ncbi:unnamed protein product [Choristocarpus tenellus]